MSTITQLLFRRGNDSSRRTTLLAAGEPGVTTDSKRLFVGDGITAGGNIAGNINFNAFTNVLNSSNSSGVDNSVVPSLSAAQLGDLYYETSTNTVYAVSALMPLNGTPTASQLYSFAKNITLSASEFFFGPNSQLNLATQGVSGFHISPAATDQLTLTINNNLTLAAQRADINPGVTGIANQNLQYAPANSVKGNFTGALSAITDQVFLTGANVYQFLGTGNNTGLSVMGLSAGQNITFTTLTATESNGQTINTVVIDSTPNLEAGDGIIYTQNPNSGHYAISNYNSLQYVRTSEIWYNGAVSAINIAPGDGTVVPTLNLPYTANANARLSAVPTLSFESVAPVSNSPAITLYWTTTGTGGSNVTVFATNSSQTPISFAPGGYVNPTYLRSPLFPSYWMDYSWTTSTTTSYWVGGDSGHADGNRQLVTNTVYTTNTILANWPASVNCMCLSGTGTAATRLWIGGNFMNLGPIGTTQNTTGTLGAIRYGIAAIDLLSGASIGGASNLGNVGSVVTLSGITTTQGMNILNSNIASGNFGLTQLTPGFSVNQITLFNSLLCVGGCWASQGTGSSSSTPPSLQQPSTSFAIFDSANNYNLSAYKFIAYNPANANKPDVPATITALVSAGSFLYIAGNFYKCSLAGAKTPLTNCAGLTRIKLSPNSNTGTSIDNAGIGTIDADFTANVANQLYNNTTTINGQTVWTNPIICLDAVPNLSGGYILYAGGKHFVQYGSQANANYRYQNLTTHWIGNTALGGNDGNLTNFNAIFNAPVYSISHNPNDSINYNVYVGGAFTTFTSQRQQNQTQIIPCNKLVAFDTTGFQYPITSNFASDSALNGNGGDYQNNNIYTSPDAPLLISSWYPAFNDNVTGIDFHDGGGSVANQLSAIYCTGKFTAVGATKAPYAAAISLPSIGGYTVFTGLYPAPWTPYPNVPFTNTGGKGTNILRIPYTSPLSGVVLGGTVSFNAVNGSVRQGWARLTGLGESLTTNTSAVNWCIAGNVLGQGNYINIDNTFLASLSDPVIAPYTVNSVTFGSKAFPSLIHVHRGDLCRFLVYRPGGYQTAFNGGGTGIQKDTFNNNVQLLGIKIDWDTGTAIGNYPYNGYASTIHAPVSSLSGQS